MCVCHNSYRTFDSLIYFSLYRCEIMCEIEKDLDGAQHNRTVRVFKAILQQILNNTQYECVHDQ